jgi:hypothetical protein
MTRFLTDTTRPSWCVVAAALLFVSACSPNRSESNFAKVQQTLDGSIAALKSKGAKLEVKTYPQGSAYSVKLSSLPVDDEVLDHVMMLGYITELDLSKSTITDAQMEKLNKISGFWLMKLDLSNTAITDAGFEKLTLAFISNLNLTGTKVTPAAVERFKKKRAEDGTIMQMFKKPTIQL